MTPKDFFYTEEFLSTIFDGVYTQLLLPEYSSLLSSFQVRRWCFRYETHQTGRVHTASFETKIQMQLFSVSVVRPFNVRVLSVFLLQKIDRNAVLCSAEPLEEETCGLKNGFGRRSWTESKCRKSRHQNFGFVWRV